MGKGNGLGSGPGNRSTGGFGHHTESSYSRGWRPGPWEGATAIPAQRGSSQETARQPNLGQKLALGVGRGADPPGKPCSLDRSCPSGQIPPLFMQAEQFSQLDLEPSSPAAGRGRTRKEQSLGVVGFKYSSYNPTFFFFFFCVCPRMLPMLEMICCFHSFFLIASADEKASRELKRGGL